MELVSYIRSEHKFGSIDALITQIGADAEDGQRDAGISILIFPDKPFTFACEDAILINVAGMTASEP